MAAYSSSDVPLHPFPSLASLLDEKLLKIIPLVNEANAISEELSKQVGAGHMC